MEALHRPRAAARTSTAAICVVRCNLHEARLHVSGELSELMQIVRLLPVERPH